MDEDDNIEDFIASYGERLHHVDDFVQVVLNGHLDIEGELDSYLGRIFEHVTYLEDARLSFHHKVCIARAYTPLSHDRPEWKIIGLLNSARNKIAHRSKHRALQIDTSKIRELLEGISESLRAELTNASVKDVMVYAAAICSGFISVLDGQLAEYKGANADDE